MRLGWMLGLALGVAACAEPEPEGASSLDAAPSLTPSHAVANYVGMPVETAAGVEVLRFSGIRYAQPPVGERRWRAPVGAAPKGRVDASRWPPACVQDNGTAEWYQSVAAAFGHAAEEGFPASASNVAVAVPPMDEDCLFLNVWTPNTEGRLPVLVWIHGGGNVNANEAQPNQAEPQEAQWREALAEAPDAAALQAQSARAILWR